MTAKSEYNFDTVPNITGTFETIYRRAKSRDLVIGSAKFIKSRKEWKNLTGPRGMVTASIEKNGRTVQPKVVAWK